MSTSNAARQINAPCQEIPIKLSEISNLFKEEHQSGWRDAVDVDWTKT
jgi:hypothetical protein